MDAQADLERHSPHMAFYIMLYTSVTNKNRSPSDQRPTYFFTHRAGARPMIARTPGHFGASVGDRTNFKSHLKFYPTSGPGRNRVEIGLRSDDQRTEIARHRSHCTCVGKNQSIAQGHINRPATVRSSEGLRPMTDGRRTEPV